MTFSEELQNLFNEQNLVQILKRLYSYKSVLVQHGDNISLKCIGGHLITRKKTNKDNKIIKYFVNENVSFYVSPNHTVYINHKYNYTNYTNENAFICNKTLFYYIEGENSPMCVDENGTEFINDKYICDDLQSVYIYDNVLILFGFEKVKIFDLMTEKIIHFIDLNNMSWEILNDRLILTTENYICISTIRGEMLYEYTIKHNKFCLSGNYLLLIDIVDVHIINLETNTISFYPKCVDNYIMATFMGDNIIIIGFYDETHKNHTASIYDFNMVELESFNLNICSLISSIKFVDIDYDINSKLNN